MSPGRSVTAWGAEIPIYGLVRAVLRLQVPLEQGKSRSNESAGCRGGDSSVVRRRASDPVPLLERGDRYRSISGPREPGTQRCIT